MLYIVFAAIVSWLVLWGVINLPVNSMTKVFFFSLLFFAITSTFMPAVAYLNARFGRFRSARVYRMRFVRQSIQIGVFVIVIAWLQMQRVLNLTTALILVGVFILVAVLLNMFLNKLIIRRIKLMSRVANDISLGSGETGEFHYEGSDEVASLAKSFNRMRRSLTSAMDMLEQNDNQTRQKQSAQR